MKNKIYRYDWEALVIVTILMIVSVFMIHAGFTDTNGMIFVIFGLFFIFVGIYVWYLYICNVLIKPKKKTLYLVSKEKTIYEFLDIKGKKYYFRSRKKYELDKFYCVLKTRDDVKEVLELSSEKFEIIESNSYWLNFYTPVGNYERIFLLPIVYVIFFACLIDWILSNVFDSSIIIMVIISLYLIVYDLIYKIKKRNAGNGAVVDDSKLQKSFAILLGLIPVVLSFLACSCLIFLFFMLSDLVSRLFMAPFVVCGISLFCGSVASLFGKIKLVNIFEKIFNFSVFIYIFCIIGISVFFSIKGGQYGVLLFTIPFLIAAIVALKKFFKKK